MPLPPKIFLPPMAHRIGRVLAQVLGGADGDAFERLEETLIQSDLG